MLMIPYWCATQLQEQVGFREQLLLQTVAMLHDGMATLV